MRPLKLLRLGCLGVSACVLLAVGQPTSAATDEQIEQAITDGIAWIASTQQPDGRWGGHFQMYTAETCFALIKLQDRAFELGYDSPFDPAYEYVDEILLGWQYVLHDSLPDPRTTAVPIAVQTHGDPDTNGNGYGVQFENIWGGLTHYTTGVCMMAMASTGDPSRPNDGGLDFDGDLAPDTYGQLMQEAVDFLAFGQTDGPNGQGGWDYYPHNNEGGRADNSVSGYVTLGLAAAQNFGATVPQFVFDELEIWVNYIQYSSADLWDGVSGYDSPFSWWNVLKTGNLLFEMKLVGDDPSTSPRFLRALAYIERFWQDASQEPGWGYALGQPSYQAMFTLMKGLEFSNVPLIDTDGDSARDDDWFNQEPPTAPPQDFASVIVSQQLADGSWPGGCFWGNPHLCTVWALLTLEKISPVADPFQVAVDKDYRYTSVCFERDDDVDGLFNEDPADFDPMTGLAIDNDGDGVANEDDVNCDPSDVGYELPVTGIDPEAYTVEAVIKKNGKVSSYNPGQYYAVSTVTVTRLNPAVDTVALTIVEDFTDCADGDYPLGALNPQHGGGSVVIVEIIDGVAYQVYDAMSGVITVDRNATGAGIKATAEFEYAFGEGQDEALLLVYVKFAPGLKDAYLPDPPDNMCMNVNSGLLEVFEEGEQEPAFSTDQEAEAWLKVVPKE